MFWCYFKEREEVGRDSAQWEAGVFSGANKVVIRGSGVVGG